MFIKNTDYYTDYNLFLKQLSIVNYIDAFTSIHSKIDGKCLYRNFTLLYQKNQDEILKKIHEDLINI